MKDYKYSALIVDDDPDDRESIRDAFLENKHDYEYIFIENGEKLMTYLRDIARIPSFILLDLNMPGKDGREALKEIKGNKDLYQIPVVVLTTSSSIRDKRHSYELGANCFITKPNTYSKLIDITDCIGKLWFA